jgi:hypothetical protein
MSDPRFRRISTASYEGLDSPFSPERARGLLYSCDAGFLDVAHIRKSADWARYLALEIRAALVAGKAAIVIQAEEPSRYHLAFRYPPDWQRLAPGERDAVIAELSIRLGQHVSEVANTWHEIITFYGYSSTPVLSEKRSAFTYDDMTSHLVGARVAGMAMRDGSQGYDAALTGALGSELARLRVVSAAETKIALQAVKGRWWDSFSARKRDLRAALDDRHTVPWIVRGLSFCPDPRPAPLNLPGLADVGGRDFTGFLDLAIEPNIPQAEVFLASLDPRPDLVRPTEHFPAIMAGIRSSLVADYDEGVDQPYP